MDGKSLKNNRLSELKNGLFLWAIGIGSGMLFGSIPLLGTAGQADPFDKMSTYLVWWAGLLFSSMTISLANARRVWRWAIAVVLGFIGAMILFIFRGEHFFLFPFSLILHAGISTPPAFAGAYFGRFIKRQMGKRNSPKKPK